MVIDGDVIAIFKYVKGCCRQEETNLLSNWKRNEKIYSNNENLCYILGKKKGPNKSDTEVLKQAAQKLQSVSTELQQQIRQTPLKTEKATMATSFWAGA